jgi:hypothetical protein
VLGQDNRLLVPAALMGGAIFLLLADTLARSVIAPAELSVGVITSFCGAPFFAHSALALGADRAMTAGRTGRSSSPIRRRAARPRGGRSPSAIQRDRRGG